MLRHYFNGQHGQLAPVDVEAELERLHQRMEPERRKGSRLFIGFVSGIAASVLIAVASWLLYVRLNQPAVVYQAQLGADGVRGVTLQRDGSQPVTIGDDTPAAQLAQLGAERDSVAGGLVLTGKGLASAATWQTLSVPSGTVFSLTLADGTRVWLNADSQLSYPEQFAGGQERVVRLRGEAYFDVAKDAARPFIVEAGTLATRVLGTQFNVRSYADSEQHVTLVEGSVAVSTNGASGRKLTLHPGEDAQVSASGSLSVQRVDTDLFTAWKDGNFYFDNATLGSVARAIGQWYNVDVVFRKRDAMEVRVMFAADRQADIAATIELLNGLQKAHFRMDGRTLVAE